MWINNVLIVACVLYVCTILQLYMHFIGNFPVKRWERPTEITISSAIVRGFHWEFSSFKLEKDNRNKLILQRHLLHQLVNFLLPFLQHLNLLFLQHYLLDYTCF